MSDTRFAAWEPRPVTGHDPDRTTFRLRPIVEDDFPAATRIIHAREGTDPERILDRLRRETTSAQARCHISVAVVGNDVVGWAKSRRFTPPPDAPANVAPPGWYLAGLILDPAHRRRGIGLALTRYRLDRLAGCTDAVYYFANAQNTVTIDLHAQLGFSEMTRDFFFPGVTFSGDGVGILYRLDLAGWTATETPS